jgi:hypothetical protein
MCYPPGVASSDVGVGGGYVFVGVSVGAGVDVALAADVVGDASGADDVGVLASVDVATWAVGLGVVGRGVG